jgi:putative nucleotide binding protein
MHASSPSDAEDGKTSPFSGETHIRILDMSERRPVGFEVHALTEPSLYLVRAKVLDREDIDNGSRVPIEDNKLGPLSLLRYRDLSTNGEDLILDELIGAIKDNSELHLGFYNRANNISLKVHAFQLLPGVGKSKAQKMVQSRGMAGWMEFSEVDEACEIDSVKLLAERYLIEIEDPLNNRSILDHLIRSSN